MPDNAFRYVSARSAPWLPQCSGQNATRYAAPRRCRNIDVIGYPSVTCNGDSGSCRRGAAPFDADNAPHRQRGLTADVQPCAPRDSRSRARRRREHDVMPDDHRDEVPYAGVHTVPNECLYLAEYLVTRSASHLDTYRDRNHGQYLTSNCAGRQGQYRFATRASDCGKHLVTHPAHDIKSHATVGPTLGMVRCFGTRRGLDTATNPLPNVERGRAVGSRAGDDLRGYSHCLRHLRIRTAQDAVAYCCWHA